MQRDQMVISANAHLNELQELVYQCNQLLIDDRFPELFSRPLIIHNDDGGAHEVAHKQPDARIKSYMDDVECV